jgi:hypothetical protein
VGRTRLGNFASLNRPARVAAAVAAGSALFLVSEGAVLGQEAEPPLMLRGTSSATLAAPSQGSSQGPNQASSSAARATTPGQIGRITGVLPTPRPRSLRRTRPPTAERVHAQVRTAPTFHDLGPAVQPILTGLPDPAIPVLPPRKKLAIDDPYAPVGVRFGNINFFPVIGESVGYDSNPNRIDRPLAKGSFVSQTEGELRIQSDWSRHELTGSLRAAYNEYPSVPDASRPEGAGKLGLRLDVSRDTIVDAEAHYQLDTERPGSPELGVSVRERPIVNTEGGSVAVTQRFNRFSATLRGTIDRTDYQDVILSNGSILDQGDRAFTQYGGRLRLAYEFSPSFTPFVEGLGDTRIYDRKVNNDGFRRSSDGIGARAGAAFELTRLIKGEISAGAIQRRYDDPRLRNLTSPLVEAAVSWAVTPLTTVRLTGLMTVDETTVPGATGIIGSRATLEVAHDLRRNLTITPAFTYFENDYQGVPITEHGYNASIKLDYRLTRQIALRASYIYEQLKSSVPGSDYKANVFLVGMRLQP